MLFALPILRCKAVAGKSAGATSLALVATLLLSCSAAFAQGPIQGVPSTPRVDQPSQGGGGLGIGINIDLGSVFNAIKNAVTQNQQNKDDQNKPPVLQKKAVTVSSGTSGNYTVDWVVQYVNNTGSTLPKVTVTDGPISTVIPASLQPPPTGWAATTNALPLPADNFALWTGTNIAPHGVMTATFPAAGPAQINVNGSGDGFGPIPYVHASGRRTYLMNHHEKPGASLFNCVDMVTGSSCAGTWPRTLPLGDSSGPSGTPSNNADYVIEAGKLYYPAQNFARWGIGCYNLDTDSECGFTQLGASSNTATQTMLQGPWRVGNELYFADYDGQMYCASLSAGMPACLSGGYKIPLTDIKLHLPVRNSNALDWNNGQIVGRVVGTRLYLTSRTVWYTQNSGSNFKTHNCIETALKAACWNTTVPTRGSGAVVSDPYAYNYSNFIYYSTSGIALANCTKYATGTGQACIDLNTGLAIVLPPIFPSHLERTTAEVHKWPRTYFNGVGPNSGKGWCWDWSTANYCQGIAGAFTNPVSTGSEYGNNMDDRGCVWVYGHYTQLWGYDPNNLDATTGRAKPCAGDPGKGQITFQPLQYCSGPKPFRWTSVEVKGAPLVNYDKFIVKVLDSSNSTVLFTKDLKASGQLLASITGVDAQTLSKPLKIEVEYTPKPGMGASDKPYLEVRYNAPPIEFCFKSTHSCQQSKITNIVETPDPVKQGSYISVKVDVDKPQNCTVTPPPPVCGLPGQPPCPICGTANTPACAAQCGQPGQPACTTGDTATITGSSNAGIATGIGVSAGGILGGTVRPPVMSNGSTVCVTGDCAPKAEQSTGQEFKEPKIACVRKAKPVDTPVAAAKPRPKPVPAAAPPAPVDPNAPPKPKPKPRPKPAAKPAASNDDCE